MELTIHIGPHKTGTTAIQTAFAEAASALKRRGFLYPKTNWLYPAQHRLAFALKSRCIPGRDKPDLSREIASLCRALEKSTCKQALISSEEFFACPPEAIQRLYQAVGPARILTFLRRPDNFLISSYNQKIRQPGNGFFVPIRRFLNDPKKIAPEIDYLACVTPWAEVFGRDAIYLETYEAGRPLARTLELQEIDDVPVMVERQANQSVNGAITELMRHAKAIGMSTRRQRTLLARAAKVFDGHPPFHVSHEDRRRILEMLESDNDALFSGFGIENPYSPGKLDPIQTPRDHNLNHQDLLLLIEGLL